MLYLLYAIHVIVCLFLILVVLLQQGKGADLSVFGGGSTQTAFGARSATTLLHKLTVTSFVLFIVTTLVIGILQGGPNRSTVMSDMMKKEEQQQLPGAQPAAPAQGQTQGQGQAPAQDNGAQPPPPAQPPAAAPPASAPAGGGSPPPGGDGGR